MAFPTNAPLDLYNVFINIIFGNQNEAVFIGLSFLLLFILGARAQFPNSLTLVLGILWTVILGAFFDTVMVIGLFVGGLILAIALSRIMTRG